MKFLANENFPYPSIQFLRTAGVIIESISEVSPGISDFDVMKRAEQENATILTFDKDYGEIIFRHNIINPPAVIYFRFKGRDPEFAGIFLLKVIREHTYQIENCFTVIEASGVRQRTYSK
jgi:predicted nuclease of predicted toxin-antitoxin system